MSYVNHDINAMIFLNQESAKKRILDVLKKTKMHKGEAAKELGCSHATLLRWIARLQLDEAIDKLQARAHEKGWHFRRNPSSGRPKGSKDKKPRKRRWKKAPEEAVTPG